MPIDRKLLEAAAADREKLAPKKKRGSSAGRSEEDEEELLYDEEEDGEDDYDPDEVFAFTLAKKTKKEKSGAFKDAFSEKNKKRSHGSADSEAAPPPAMGTAAAAVAAAAMLLLLITRSLPLENLPFRDNIYLAIAVFQLVSLALPAVFFAKLRGGSASLLSRMPAPSDLGLTAVFTLFAIVAASTVKFFLCRAGVYESAYSAYSPTLSFVSGASLTDTVYIIVTFALIPAICEGFLFRGLILSEYLHGGSGIAASVLTGAVLYAFSGFSIGRFPLALLTGIILGYLAVVSRSSFAAMFAQLMTSLVDLFADTFITGLAASDYHFLFMLLLLAALLICAIWTAAELEKHYYIASVNASSPAHLRPRGSDTALPQRRGGLLRCIGGTLFNPVVGAALVLFIAGALLI